MKFSALCLIEEFPTEGTLDHFTPFFLIYNASKRRGANCLTLSEIQFERRLYFRDGELYHVQSNKNDETILPFLYKRKIIDQTVNSELINEGDSTETIINTLILKGVFSRADADKLIIELLRWRYLNCFFITSGSYSIRPIENKILEKMTPSLHIVQFIESFAKIILDHFDHDDLHNTLIQNKNRMFCFTSNKLPVIKNTNINDLIRSYLGRVKDGKILADILPPVDQANLTIKEIILYLLIELQIIDYQLSEKEQETLAKVERIRSRIVDIGKKNYFQILEVSPNVSIAEIKKFYFDTVKHYHPDRFNQRYTIIYKKLIEDYFARITEAYHRLNSEEKILEYRLQLDLQRSGKNVEDFVRDVMQAEQNFVMGQRFLGKRQYKKAVEYFQSAAELHPEEKYYRAHYLYATFWQKNTEQPELAQDIVGQLERLSKEQQASGMIHLMLARIFKEKKNFNLAKLHYQKAVKIDPKLSEAEAELKSLGERVR